MPFNSYLQKVLKSGTPFLINLQGNSFGNDYFMVVTVRDYKRMTGEASVSSLRLYRHEGCKWSGKLIFIDLFDFEVRQIKKMIQSGELVRTAGGFYQWRDFEFKEFLNYQKL